MPEAGPLDAGWRHGTGSTGSDSTCVDVAVRGGTVLVRDSKDPHGPSLRFGFDEWQVFLDGVRDGEFELPGPPTHHPPIRADTSSDDRRGRAARRAASSMAAR